MQCAHCGKVAALVNLFPSMIKACFDCSRDYAMMISSPRIEKERNARMGKKKGKGKGC